MNKATLRFFALVALLALGVFCKINFSDGDDAIFDDMVRSMPYLEYIKMRYLTWTGRIGGETLAYLTFSLGIWFWRFANAAMVATVPMLILLIVKHVSPPKEPQAKESLLQPIRLPIIACAGYLLMDIFTFGHGAVWVTGSVFYTWPFVCALLCIYLNLRFLDASTISKKQLAFLFPLLFLASTSIEQIGAVLFAFFAGTIFFYRREKRFIPTGFYVEAAFTVILLAIVIAAPGNSARIIEETQAWFPTFGTLPFTERAFISVQWILSSFANEGKLFFVFIWIGCLMATQIKKPNVSGCLIVSLYSVFSVIALLSFGHPAFADTGISYIDPAVRPEVFPSIANASALNILVMVWWSAATLFTFYTLKVTLGTKGCALFAIALLCEAMMFFSPTLYASGERVFFVTDWLLLIIVLQLFTTIPERLKNTFFGLILCWAVLNLVLQVPEIIAKLAQ